MNRHANAISARLSLREPQRDSLEILARVADIIPLDKERDLKRDLEVIQSEFPSVLDFERDFPSLCFALATGVGKTRLMGAFVSYLYLAKGIRHFFVLAPNLTIYNKLIADFTPGTRKYVLQGIAEFAAYPPEIITGDNYESGRGIRRRNLFGEEGPHINIFNISKINSEVRGGAMPRIKRLSEYIGQSYFDYLSELDDLVVLMDESHRYRASAGVRAINELKPILGLELTATPQVEAGAGANPVKFKNVIYSYPLSKAMEDGFVKEPAVATRENFDPANYNEEQLERLKLEDGVRIHESVKVDLEVYARQNDKPLVKPFMLIVAQDTIHANALVETIKSDDFFEGRYRDRVITVHSNQRGEEKDDVVDRLVAVESPDEPTEIVVHVNMLKEGWDVTNLYTIVPLRAASSRTLVEQSIGRGLRLPYGKRTGVAAVDRLTIVAHDRFQAIIDEANSPNSIIRTGIIIGRDVAQSPKIVVVVPSNLQTKIDSPANPASVGRFEYATPVEKAVAQTTLEIVKRYERLPSSSNLREPEIQARIVAEVKAAYTVSQGALEGIAIEPNYSEVVEKTIELFIEDSIDIPRVVVQPTGEISSGYRDFDLDTRGIRLQPVDKEILIQHLRTNAREKLVSIDGVAAEERLENYLVRALIDFDDISYDDHAELLYKLAGQAIAHMISYLPDQEAVQNVLQYHHKRIADLIHSQMQAHHWEFASSYETTVSKGFMTLRDNNYAALQGDVTRNFRTPVEDRQSIGGMLFGGFKRCLYPIQKFQSDSERRFAVLLEDEQEALKWFKPAPGQFQIYYHHDLNYEPDFVVETQTAKFLCEPKRASEMEDATVLAKAKAAVIWCERATTHELAHGGKPWSYLLIPHDAINANKTLRGLIATFAKSCD